MEDISASNWRSTTQPQQELQSQTPLPIKQLLTIATVLLAESLTDSIIRSFNNALVTRADPYTGFSNNDAPKASFRSQFLESILFFAQAATAYQWGKLSDKLGRRPILLMGPFGLWLSTFALGVTNNVWVQAAARSMEGVFSGNIETTKTAIAEITDDANRHRAYAVLPSVRSIGLSTGSSVGNFLATLKGRLPILERIPFIRDHPLFIPCTVSSSFSFFSFLLIHKGFQETLPAEYQVDWRAFWKVKDQAKYAFASSIPSIPTCTTALLGEARSMCYRAIHIPKEDVENTVCSIGQEVTRSVPRADEGLLPIDEIQEVSELLINRQLTIALLNYVFISFLDQAQQTLLPMMYISIEEYGLLSEETTKTMAKWGCFNTLVQLLLFPWLLQRFGSKKVYSACLSSMILFFALFPVFRLTAAYNQNTNFVVLRLLEVHMGMSSLVNIAYGCSQMFIMAAVQNRSSFGSVNGLGQTVGSSARMIAPPVISFIYTFSLKDGLRLGEYLTYALLICITMVGSMVSALLPANL